MSSFVGADVGDHLTNILLLLRYVDNFTDYTYYDFYGSRLLPS